MQFRQIRWITTLALAAALVTTIALRPVDAQDRSPYPAHTTIVTGRLLDADGKPVAGGRIVVMAEHWARFERPLGVYWHNDLPLTFRVTGPVRTDSEGRFRVEAPVGPARPVWRTLVHGAAEGHGLATVELAMGKSTQDVTIRLERESIIRGRLIDTQGQPAAGALVRPIMTVWSGAHARDPHDDRSAAVRQPADPRGDHRRQRPVPHPGIGQGQGLARNHSRAVRHAADARTADPRRGSEGDRVLPGRRRVVEGRITYGKGGKPAAGARVVAVTGDDNVVPSATAATTTAATH